MRKTGIRFFVEGEYATRLDENGEFADWQPFETRDLRADGKEEIIIWSQFDGIDAEELECMISRAVNVIDWMREERGWDGFNASLYRSTTNERVFSWEIV